MAIYVGENKAILLKGDRNVAELYKGGTKLFGFSDPVSGEMLNINDAHPVEHKMKCRVRSKNLATAQQVYTGNNSYKELTEDDRECIRFIDDKTVKYTGISFKENTQYTVSFEAKCVHFDTANAANSCLFAFFYSDDTYSWKLISPSVTDWKKWSLTSTEEKTVVAVGTVVYNYVNYVYIDVNTFQIEEGSTSTDYTPYVGDLTAVTVSRHNTNLLDYLSLSDNEYADTSFNADGSITVKNTSSALYYPWTKKQILPAGTYILKVNLLSVANATATQWFWTFEGHNYQYGFSRTSVGSASKKVTFTEPTEVRILMEVKAGEEITFTMQINKDSTTEFEKYQGLECTPSSDGTVEGITSLSPNMTLMTDTEGVVIECEYVKG